ncbi:hypothetical protein WR25_11098 [Diploscapter pachys]|uniref:Uncharacterized protein n=1 Tax=Diploscapter pachys TaxID=2018661 RepID=A0A2A2L7N3_9BILA|nr:hypothetical protein WR25_11098 [Diploscapter pachys]
MSLGSMTVMSYDIWKAKCAAEKKRLEEERKMLGLPEESKSNNPSETLRKYAKDPSSLPNDVMFSRKRTHSTSTNEEIPKISPKDAHEKKGRYILLPTIPAMKIFVKDDDQVVLDRATGCNILASTSTDNSMQPNQPNPIIVSPTTSFMSPALSAGASAITLPTIYTYQSNQPQAALLAPPLIKPVPLVSHTQASVISSMPSADPSALFRSLQQQSLLPVPDSNPFQSLLVSSLASSSLPQTPLTSAADVVQLLAQQQQLAALLRVSAAPPSLTHPHPQPHPQSIAAPAFRSVTLPSTVPSLPPHSQLPVPVSSPSFLLPPSTTADLLQSLLNHSRQQQPIISHGI